MARPWRPQVDEDMGSHGVPKLQAARSTPGPAAPRRVAPSAPASAASGDLMTGRRCVEEEKGKKMNGAVRWERIDCEEGAKNEMGPTDTCVTGVRRLARYVVQRETLIAPETNDARASGAKFGRLAVLNRFSFPFRDSNKIT